CCSAVFSASCTYSGQGTGRAVTAGNLAKNAHAKQYTNSSDGFRGVVDFLEFLPSVTGILCRPLWRVLYACRPFWPRASSGNSYRSFTVRLCLISLLRKLVSFAGNDRH